MPKTKTRLAVGETMMQLPNGRALAAAAMGLRLSAQRLYGESGHYCDDPEKASMRAEFPDSACEACVFEAAARALDGILIRDDMRMGDYARWDHFAFANGARTAWRSPQNGTAK